MPIIFSDTIPDLIMRAGEAVSLLLPEATGETGDIVYVLAPALPDGLSFSATTRRITGAAEENSAETLYTYTATDDIGSASLTFSITITIYLNSRGAGSLEDDIEAYQNVNALLRGRATKDVQNYTINGRSLEHHSISELRELAAYFGQQIRYARSGQVLRNVE